MAEDEQLEEEQAAEEAEEESDDQLEDDEVEVQEHLKDAVEGSLRLKRLLSRDEDEEQPEKKKEENSTPGRSYSQGKRTPDEMEHAAGHRVKACA